ncbi:toxin-antitoxin system HicB family antitoxin [Pseudonocardia acaciae]|uniref:toxin-antitoxin system HicB family antitoxin n=1 Tax=Pseudonocardia acaciae TaxID=551276 RepID=UPI00048DBE32|nr:toxin-antitoxin system HicB family antitoxin [Pseudonocardia acaciae]
MDVTPYVTALREDLVSAAAAGDEQTQRTAALLAAAIEPAARLAVMNALADLAAEVTEALDGDQVVEVRLDGRQVRVAVTQPTRPTPTDAPPPPPTADVGDISRITLRLMEQIKNRAEHAAAAQGMSLNAWISQAVQGALHGAPPQDWGDWSRGRKRDDERRLRGWVQG